MIHHTGPQHDPGTAPGYGGAAYSPGYGSPGFGGQVGRASCRERV